MRDSVSERRIRNNRRKRRRQRRQHMLFLAGTLMLILGISVSLFGFSSKAQSSSEEIYYKYYTSVTVQPGDTIWDYAGLYADEAYYHSYESYINEVMSINSLKDDAIKAGQHIILPYYSSKFM